MRLSKSAGTHLIRLCNLLPLVCGIVMLVLALLPRLFYQSGNDIFDEMSLFQLLENTYRNCIAVIRKPSTGSVSELYFSYIMFSFWILSWLCIVFYALFALFTAVMSGFAWEPNAPSTKLGNTLKRCYRMLVPNSACYVIFCVLPLLPACYPYLLQLFYRTVLHNPATVHYFGIPDFVPVLIFSVACSALFIITRPAQKELRMDLFRLYKAE